MLVIAHAGHWALSLLEAVPLLVAVAFVGWRSYTWRREADGAGFSEPEPDTPS